VDKLASALRAGGWLVLEDADGLLFDADPAENAFTAIAGPWQRAAAATGWNPCYGRYMVADLQRAGLGRVAGRAHRDYQPEGCLARADLDDALAALDDPIRTIIGAPIVTAWGQRTHSGT
jgi:hypothetical protein